MQNNASSSQSASGNKGRTLLLVVVVVVGGYLFLGESSKPKLPPLKKTVAESTNLALFLPVNEANRTTEALFKDGLREYFAGNYNRARTQFETVLQIAPTHALASLYLENCQSAVKEDVRTHLEYGKKSSQAGKLREAKAHFERVLRLLHKDQANPAFIEARDQYDKVVKTINNSESSVQ